MATVVLDSLTKIYDEGSAPAVDALSIDIADGEFVVLVGPSGCGKSTALRMIAGLEEISDGDLRIDDVSVTQTAPQDRDIAMVFQNYALYPHMTVGKNLSYPLRVAGRPKAEIAERVQAIAQVLEIEEFLDRKPGQLSGGQRQRVAMGRALIRQPKVFLMDEPLSNLDAKLRVYMRSEIARIQQELGITTVYVTHDQVEAMTMGHRVVVLKDGVLQQAASPQELYDHPANMFVAAFIGSPAMNLFSTRVSLGGEPSLTMGEQTVALPESILAQRPALEGLDGAHVIAGIRPDDCYDAALSPDMPAVIQADVRLTESLGSEIVVHLDAGIEPVDTGDPDLDELGGSRDDDTNAAFLARFSPHSTVKVGDRADVAIDTAKLHFFDPETGAAIRG